MRITIVSGGQRGADRGAMDAAIRLGLDYGGWAPAGFRSEDGVIPAIYATHMRETSSSEYGMRTRLNVQDSDGTLIVSYEPELTGGSAGTAKAARAMKRPCKHLVLPQGRGKVPDEVRVSILEWLRASRIETLNVAGPRESKEPGVQVAVRDVLVWLLEDVATEQLREVIDTVSLLESVVDSDAPRDPPPTMSQVIDSVISSGGDPFESVYPNLGVVRVSSSSPAAAGASDAGVPLASQDAPGLAAAAVALEPPRDTVVRPADATDDDPMEVVLVRASDGALRAARPSHKSTYTWADEFWWTEGNYGCDCNRALDWARNAPADRPESEPEETPCGHSRFFVILCAPSVMEFAIDVFGFGHHIDKVVS